MQACSSRNGHVVPRVSSVRVPRPCRAAAVGPVTVGAGAPQVCYGWVMRETRMASMGSIELSDLRPHLVREAVVQGPAWTVLVVQPFVLLREGLLPRSSSS
jgi:hypothetical protein